MRGWKRQAHAITVLGRREESALRMSKNSFVKERSVGPVGGRRLTLDEGWYRLSGLNKCT